MSTIDEDQIRDRLEALSQAEPTQEATDRAMQKARDTLKADEARRVGLAPPSFSSLVKLAAAAALMIGLGYLGGRLSAPAPLDAGQLRADIESSLRASLEPAIRQDLLEEMDTRWDSTFAAKSVELKDEFQQQVRRDLMEFAARTLEYAGNQTNQRLDELARQFYAARVQDRQRAAEAFAYLNSNMLLEKSQLENVLVALAARTSELPSPQE
ncbi:MAG: hypothetical protein ACYSWQ_08220 [Planctomycetota bacterium]|jgi:hypothetical protein